ncbi:membrane-associated sensor domain-containing protein [Klebsiella aerogenes]|uniref:GGDEF domain-containing protein n=1 Tax=Klebsiella aerogenes TaxID=548 RepID=UPI0037BD3255
MKKKNIADDVLSVGNSRGYIWFSGLNIIYCIWLIVRGADDKNEHFISVELNVIYIIVVVLSSVNIVLSVSISEKNRFVMMYILPLFAFLLGVSWGCGLYFLVERFNNALVTLVITVSILLSAMIAFYISTLLLMLFIIPIVFSLLLTEFYALEHFSIPQLMGSAIILMVVCSARYVLLEWYHRARESELENQRLIRQLTRIADNDGLTGLRNRRGIKPFLENQIKNLHPSQSIYAIVMDVDFFKQYNDMYGHIAGDACLIKVAGCIRISVRTDSDGVFRFGGEEFVILTTGDTDHLPVRLSERIQQTLQKSRIVHHGSQVSEFITLSIGIAKYEDGMSLKQLLEKADISLYKAKNAGRNTIIFER